MKRLIWLAAALFLFWLPHAAQAGSPPSLGEYRAQIHALRSRLDELPRSAQPLRIKRGAETRLKRLALVRLPNGRVVATDLPALADVLRTDSTLSIGSVARSLDALDDALRSTGPAPADPASLSALDSVLRDSRFHPSENPVQQFFDWLGGQIDRFLGWIGDLLRNLVPGGPSASLPAYVFALVFLVVVVGAALLIARAVIHRASSEAPAVDERAEPRTSVAARDRLDRYLAGGDYRLALRYLLLTTLLELQERDVLRLRPGLTNREYLRDLERDLSTNRAVAQPMAELIEVFDRTWYGHLPIDEREYARCVELSREAMQAATLVGAA
jgi:hypothetical protein